MHREADANGSWNTLYIRYRGVTWNNFPFGRISTTWNRGKSMRLWQSFFWLESCIFPFQGAICHRVTRWFHNVSINQTRTHQEWRNIATLGAHPNAGLSRVHLTSVPLLAVLRRSICEGLTNMLHDKTNRVRWSAPHYSFRNARSLRYLAHWREWLFIKRCPSCLINNIRTFDIGLASLSGVQSSSMRYLMTVDGAIEPGPRVATSYLWMIEADSSCLSKKSKSSTGPSCMMSNLHVIIILFVIEILAVWWAERYQSSYWMEWITHHMWFVKL
jgi:hypothetical protein